MPSPFDKSIEEKCVVQFVRRSAVHVLHIPCMHIRMSWICQQQLLLWSRLQSWARLWQTHIEVCGFTTKIIDLIVYPFDDDDDGCECDASLIQNYMPKTWKSETDPERISFIIRFFFSFQTYFFSPTIVDGKKREKTRQFSAENGNMFRWFGKFDVLSARVKVEIMHREVELFWIELNGSGCACTLWDVVHWGCTKENCVKQFHWYDHSISGLMKLSIKLIMQKPWRGALSEMSVLIRSKYIHSLWLLSRVPGSVRITSARAFVAPNAYTGAGANSQFDRMIWMAPNSDCTV